MGIAALSALRSKDPSTQVGACIVDNEKKVVSIGYNGMPRRCNEDKLTWNKNEGLDSKYLYVCHAEFNAILNTKGGHSLHDCVLYVTLFPCNECAKAIIQTGIKEVFYASLSLFLRWRILIVISQIALLFDFSQLVEILN